MATIRPNDNAPAEEVHYTLPTATFDLDAGGSFETDDRQALADAEAHPWLTVEYPEVDVTEYQRPEKSVPWKEDYLSSFESRVNDPEAIREAEEGKYENSVRPLAVESGLDQGESVVEDERVAVTIAADEAEDVTDEPSATDDDYRSTN